MEENSVEYHTPNNLRHKPRVDFLMVFLVLLVGGMLATLSVMRYRGYNTGMADIGNMSQSIWSVTQGRPLEFTLGNRAVSRLACHVEVFYYALVPFYLLFPSPVTLLIFQALLFASAAYPLYQMARRHLQAVGPVRLVTLAYLFYPVAQTAVLFDFHGDTLAMPLIIYALEAVDREDWWTYGTMLFLALMCKFYVGVALVAFGLVLYLEGKRWAGVATGMVGAVWLAVAYFIVRPTFYPVASVSARAVTGSYFAGYFGELWTILRSPQLLWPRIGVALLILAPALWLGRRALLWFIPALSIVIPAVLVAGRVATYDYRYHHYALAVPWLAMAMLRGARRVQEKQLLIKAENRGSVSVVLETAFQFVLVLLFSSLLVDIPLNPLFWSNPPGWGRDVMAYGRTLRDDLKDEWLARHVDPGDSVMASILLASHIANRSELYVPTTDLENTLHGSARRERITYRLARADVVVLDALYDFNIPTEAWWRDQPGLPLLEKPFHGVGHPPPVSSGVLYDREAIALTLRDSDFSLVDAYDGLVVFYRNRGSSEDVLMQKVVTRTMVAGSNMDALITFDDKIGLLAGEAVLESGNRLALDLEWLAMESLVDWSPYFAVTRLAGVDNGRFVHLPTQALYPTTRWQEHELIHERMEFRLPSDLPSGAYKLMTGWYDSRYYEASQTDSRSRLGEEFELSLIVID